MNRLKVGDKVRRVRCSNAGVCVGDVGYVTKVFNEGELVYLDIGARNTHSTSFLELVEEAKMFDMKTQPWIIEVGLLTWSGKNAVKEWICDQYGFSEYDLPSHNDVEYYTNWLSMGVQSKPMYGRNITGSDLHDRTKKACHEIVVSLKTELVVESVTWPEVETPEQKRSQSYPSRDGEADRTPKETGDTDMSNVIDHNDINETGELAVKLKWFHYSQNNSGGYFIKDDMVCEDVFIQDVSAKRAQLRAEEIFEDRSDYCPCCGERWYTDTSDKDGTDVPEIYGTSIYETDASTYHEEVRLHYFDGRVETYKYAAKLEHF